MRSQNSEPLMRTFGLVMWASLLCTGCGEKTVENLPKYPVSGNVLVNGKAVAGVMVMLSPQGDSSPNARVAAGVTDAEGNFELTTIIDGDGAFPGEYAVTFKWLEPNEFPPRDRFDGIFADTGKSKYQVTVEKTDNVLEPFQLQFGN